ncbi:MAG: UDP-N-acetylmuramate dehydrogenase [Nocardioides sp.]
MSDGRRSVLLRDHTTLRLGGPADRFVVASSETDLVGAVQRADERGEPLLIIGEGSNIVIGDGGFPGTVVKVATSGVSADVDEADTLASCGGVTVEVAAGESWEHFVERAVGQGWVGVEALAGIPGLVGATPIQNVGAYGQEVADTIASVRTWDRVDRCQRTYAAGDCGFGYRTSRFKIDPGRYVVLEVIFQLRQGTWGAPIRYAELARSLGVQPGDRAPIADVRRAVLALRAGKGMVLDPADYDTWSAGSFFTNPVLDPAGAEELPADAPRWVQPDGTVKTSAAWLIERAGFAKGFRLGSGAAHVAVSGKHTLALTNRGGARTDDLIRLASVIRAAVRSAYGIELDAEPTLVGCALTDADPSRSSGRPVP